jgi:hypothetical protein
MLGTVLGVAAGVLEGGLSLRWFQLLRRVQIPADQRGFIAGHALAAALGVAALALGASTLGAILAWVAVLSAVIFFALAAQKAQPPLIPAVAVGGPILEFTLPDHQGKAFDLATLRGRPFLLKFFRGHW